MQHFLSFSVSVLLRGMAAMAVLAMMHAFALRRGKRFASRNAPYRAMRSACRAKFHDIEMACDGPFRES